MEFCRRYLQDPDALCSRIICSDEAIVRQCSKDKDVQIRVHSNACREDLPVNAQEDFR